LGAIRARLGGGVPADEPLGGGHADFELAQEGRTVERGRLRGGVAAEEAKTRHRRGLPGFSGHTSPLQSPLQNRSFASQSTVRPSPKTGAVGHASGALYI